jgi:hypothetical protein
MKPGDVFDFQTQMDIGIIAKMKPYFAKGEYRIRVSDGKIVGNYRTDPEVPWHYIKHSEWSRCHLWHNIFFDIFKMLPSECLNCYKVVVRPRTLKEHFALEELMYVLNRDSKLGIEIRPQVCGLYGAYFYNRGLDEGMERYKEVREAVSDIISPDIPVILKRGCTEFESSFGPSDKWDWLIREGQVAYEKVLDEIFEIPRETHTPTYLVDYVHAKWIQWAHQNGDKTYLEFTGGKPLFPGYVIYHDGHKPEGRDEKIIIDRGDGNAVGSVMPDRLSDRA